MIPAHETNEAPMRPRSAWPTWCKLSMLSRLAGRFFENETYFRKGKLMLSRPIFAIVLGVAAAIEEPGAIGVGMQAFSYVGLAVVAGLVFIIMVLLAFNRDALFRAKSTHSTTTYTLSFPKRTPARRTRKRRRGS